MKTVPVDSLKPHPLNDQIYKDEADDAFVDRVERLGIIQPLLVTEEGLIISGHRRLDAALKLGLEQVPVLVVEPRSRLDIEEMLIEANRHRRQSNEQLVREYQHLAHIEERRLTLAARQEQAAQDAQVQSEMTVQPEFATEQAPTLEVPEVGQIPAGPPLDDPMDGVFELPPDFDIETARRAARKAVARHVGRSQTMLDRGVSVVERIDGLHQEEKHDQATELRKILNHRSVGAAFKKAYGVEEPPTDPGPPLRRMRKLAEDLETWLDAAEENPEAADALRSAITHLRDAVALFDAAAELDSGPETSANPGTATEAT